MRGRRVLCVLSLILVVVGFQPAFARQAGQSTSLDLVFLRLTPSSDGLIIADEVKNELTAEELRIVGSRREFKGTISLAGKSAVESLGENRRAIVLVTSRPSADAPLSVMQPNEPGVVYLQEQEKVELGGVWRVYSSTDSRSRGPRLHADKKIVLDASPASQAVIRYTITDQSGAIAEGVAFTWEE